MTQNDPVNKRNRLNICAMLQLNAIFLLLDDCKQCTSNVWLLSGLYNICLGLSIKWKQKLQLGRLQGFQDYMHGLALFIFYHSRHRHRCKSSRRFPGHKFLGPELLHSSHLSLITLIFRTVLLNRPLSYFLQCPISGSQILRR